MLYEMTKQKPRIQASLARPDPVIGGIVLFVVVLNLLAFALPALFPRWADLSAFYLVRQDRGLLFVELAVLAISLFGARGKIRQIAIAPFAPLLLAGAVFCFCLAGHYWILGGYDLSRDEQMAVFDARIFETGRLVQPLPTFWQSRSDALNTLFMLPAAHRVAWVSGYLPMNAVLRATIGRVVDPATTGPLMTGLGLIFLWNCARRLWPNEREPATVAVLLYIGSGQILFAGMTAYAMPTHLTLDLLWLWLFLIRRRAADAGALTVGFVTTGLHQPLFHPLFVLPFLVGLVRDRSWLRALFYAVGYAAICVFWLAWPMLMHPLIAGQGAQSLPTGTDYVTRLLATLKIGDQTRWADMAANLLRFAAWQPVLLLPLMGAGVASGRRERPTLALAVSVILPLAVMTVILPYQGHGFGYRYLQGVLGTAILLAAQGWRHLSRQEARLRPLFLLTTIAGCLMALPVQAWMAHSFYAPYGLADDRIRASGADYVILGQADAPFEKDLVLNRPNLDNRPIRLLAEQVDDGLIATVCRPGARVALPTNAFFARIDAEFLMQPDATADARAVKLSAKLEAAGCTVERLD